MIKKEYYLRKNQVLVLTEITGSRKKEDGRTWGRPRVCGEGWVTFEDISAIAQLEVELQEKKLIRVPDTLMEKAKNAWRKDEQTSTEP